MFRSHHLRQAPLGVLRPLSPPADGRSLPPRVRYWLITFADDPAGVAYLQPGTSGNVEVTAFGLLPAYVGKGLGGYALTLALRQAWATEPLDAPVARRVWLHTCTEDHPHALGNYEKRGMRPYRVDPQPPDRTRPGREGRPRAVG
ncbi:GNAT family N-acetyltransferase [Streptomyces sp. NPDC054975]